MGGWGGWVGGCMCVCVWVGGGGCDIPLPVLNSLTRAFEP